MEKQLEILGWREWVALPQLNISKIKCKVDTGARTSALHAYFVEPDTARNTVRFGIHPFQNNTETRLICETDIKDYRLVSDSGGHKEKRYVIESDITLGRFNWRIEINLTDRDTMRFRMLLGRTAIKNRFLVDPFRSYLMRKPTTKRKNSRRQD